MIGKMVQFTGEGGGFITFKKGDIALIESVDNIFSDMVWVTDGKNKTLAHLGVEVVLMDKEDSTQ